MGFLFEFGSDEIIQMTVYVALTVFMAWLSAVHARSLQLSWGTKSAVTSLSIALILMMGLRTEVGGDWAAYLNYLESMRGEPLKALFTTNEPGYLFLNWLGANVWGGIYTVNTLSAALLVWGLVAFSRCQPRPLLAMLVATC